MYSHKKFYKLLLLLLELFTPWCVGTCVVLSVSCLLCVDTCSGGVGRVTLFRFYNNTSVPYLSMFIKPYASQDFENPQLEGGWPLSGEACSHSPWQPLL